VLDAALALAGPELASVDLSYCPGLNHDTLLAALQHRPALRSVRVRWFARDGEEDGEYYSEDFCRQLFAHTPPQMTAVVGLKASSLSQVVKLVRHCGGPDRLSVCSLQLYGSTAPTGALDEDFQATLLAALPQLTQLHLDHCPDAFQLLFLYLLGRVSFLTALRLHRCLLKGVETAMLLTCFGSSVTELYINNDREDPFHGTEEACDWWLRRYWPPPKLRRLSLRGMDLWRSELGTSLVARLLAHPTLAVLDVSDNTLPFSLSHPQPPGLESLEQLVAHNSPALAEVTMLRSLVVTHPEGDDTASPQNGLTPLMRSLVQHNTHLRRLTLDGVPPSAVQRTLLEAAVPDAVPSRSVVLTATGAQRRRSGAYGEHWEPLEVRLTAWTES
jgi:hypothetical protein